MSADRLTPEQIAAEVVGRRVSPGMGGGSERVVDAYRPEGVAVLLMNAYRAAGYVIVHPDYYPRSETDPDRVARGDADQWDLGYDDGWNAFYRTIFGDPQQ